jgi:modification methylase
VSDWRQIGVWPVAQACARDQRRGRYLRASNAHPGKMLPELARTVIRSYSRPGDLVFDPMSGIGTTLVEAIHLGRSAIGLELEPRWASLAAANILHAEAQGAKGIAIALQADARRLWRGFLAQYEKAFALILTSPPYGRWTHGHVRLAGARVEHFDHRYSNNSDNLAHLPACPGPSPRQDFDSALAEILAGCRRLLGPNGRLVLTARPYRRGEALIDLPGQIIGLAAEVGLQLERRHAALLCGLRGRDIVPRPSFFQLQRLRSGVVPRMLLIAHEDVLVFRK